MNEKPGQKYLMNERQIKSLKEGVINENEPTKTALHNNAFDVGEPLSNIHDIEPGSLRSYVPVLGQDPASVLKDFYKDYVDVWEGCEDHEPLVPLVIRNMKIIIKMMSDEGLEVVDETLKTYIEQGLTSEAGVEALFTLFKNADYPKEEIENFIKNPELEDLDMGENEKIGNSAQLMVLNKVYASE